MTASNQTPDLPREEVESVDSDSRRALLRKLGHGAAYVAPATLLILSSEKAAAY